MEITIPDSLYDEIYEKGFREAEDAFKGGVRTRIGYDFVFVFVGLMVGLFIGLAFKLSLFLSH